MSNIPQSIQITFSISGCKCKEFSLTDFAINNKTEIPADRYIFNSSVSMDINKEKKEMTVEIISILFADTEEIKSELATLKSDHTFKINNIENILLDTTQGISIPNQILTQFFTMSFSNLRGMYSIKLEGTLYSNVVLPIIDVSRLLPTQTIPLG